MNSSIKRAAFGRIRRFVRGEGVRIFFQPITDLDTGTVVGFESLARFDSTPDRSTMSWFDEATAAGLRRELELTTARAAVSALDALPEDTYLTVNASPDVAMDPAFLSSIPEASGSRLVVEITEHAPIDDYDAFNAAIASLRSRGVRVAIDDAGAGFANLTHILRIHPDLIKLDVELTRHIDIDAQRRALVRSLVAFAKSVGATLIAEGIETEGELKALRALGVARGQGYHIGKPAPLPDGADGPVPQPHARFLPSVAVALDDARSFMRSRRAARRDGGLGRSMLRPALVAVIGALVLMPAGLAFADESSPGSVAYWLMRRIEGIRLVVALDRESEMRLHLEFARRRMDEVSELLAEDREDLVPMVLANFRDHIDAVSGSLDPAKHIPPGLRKRIVRDLTDHVGSLDDERTALCAKNGSVAGCGAADDAIRRSKKALSRSNAHATKKKVKPLMPAAAPTPPGKITEKLLKPTH